jgi:DNA topoisomerase-3
MENAGKEDMPEDAERQGLGTPATRAAMIEKLLSAGFVERKGKSLVPTKDGINLAVILPDMLKSPLLTAEWETRLTEIAKGSDDPELHAGNRGYDAGAGEAVFPHHRGR